MIREVKLKVEVLLTCDGKPCSPNRQIFDSGEIHPCRVDEFYARARKGGWKLDTIAARALCPGCVKAGEKLPQ